MQPLSGLDELGHEPRVETRPKTKTRFNPGLPNVGLAIAAIPLEGVSKFGVSHLG